MTRNGSLWMWLYVPCHTQTHACGGMEIISNTLAMRKPYSHSLTRIHVIRNCLVRFIMPSLSISPIWRFAPEQPKYTRMNRILFSGMTRLATWLRNVNLLFMYVCMRMVRWRIPFMCWFVDRAYREWWVILRKWRRFHYTYYIWLRRT